MSSESILEKPFRHLSPVLDAIKHADYFDALGDAVKRQPFVERWGQHTKPNAFKFLAFEPRQHPYLGKLCKTVKAISRRLEELLGRFGIVQLDPFPPADQVRVRFRCGSPHHARPQI